MSIDVSPSGDGGVLKEIIKEGTGEKTPGLGSHVEVHYVGTLLDGTKFDSSRDRNETFKFDLGLGQVIKGWDCGVKSMKKGEVAILTCKPDYAYGKNGSPPSIPPDATLKFEVELINWLGEDLSPKKNKAIIREVITAGSGYANPTEGGLVEAHIVGHYDGKVFEERDVKFCLGEGEAEGIVEGLEIALGKFKKGEKSKIFIKSEYAFGLLGRSEFKIPGGADVEYIAEVKSFEKGPEVWSLEAPQKLEHAQAYKDKGTSYLKDGRLRLAIKMYQKVIEFANDDYDTKDKEELNKQRLNLLLSTNLNLALCFLKANDHALAREACDKVLELDPKNEKALFRRGQALLYLASPELALKDFQEVVSIEPKNTAALKQVFHCQSVIKRELAKEKKLYANMFEKFAKQDRQ
uniref:peptidylprolyl isomerase n=1 Tax=Encarsia formosa TaxID=32400 RepID=A0A481SYZ8_ENCFO|nr:fk506-binding protein [Encarsia formosa]